jgi:rod shape determining protein RodA
MRRFLSLRDFDWTLLGFVMMLSIISVLEIYSATLHTKFHRLPHASHADSLDPGRPRRRCS